jgi:hypothetical protein
MNTANVINGETRVDDWILVVPSDAYGNLIGRIKEIVPLGSTEHTDGDTDDVYVSFSDTGYPDDVLENIAHLHVNVLGNEGSYALMSDLEPSGVETGQPNKPSYSLLGDLHDKQKAVNSRPAPEAKPPGRSGEAIE